ncbi:hypothetical protein CITFRE_24720 [Citrobacter freundii]|nr:hypothetical protein CITFRE_24720 [Citrobacter freundii]
MLTEPEEIAFNAKAGTGEKLPTAQITVANLINTFILLPLRHRGLRCTFHIANPRCAACFFQIKIGFAYAAIG